LLTNSSPLVCANVSPHPSCLPTFFNPGHSTPYCPRYFPAVAQANSSSGPSALATVQSGKANEALWYPDSTASSHMNPIEGIFSRKLPYNGSDSIVIGDGTYLPISNVGQVHLSASTSRFKLNNVLHVPNLKYNMLSVQKLCSDNNYEVGFDSSSVHVKDKATGKILLHGTSDGGVYTLSSYKPIPALLVVHASSDIWHRRLGHCGSRVLESVRHKQFIKHHSKFSNKCMLCKLGKAHRLTFNDAEHCYGTHFHLEHFDVWPSPIISNLNFRHYVVFVVDCFRFTWIYPVKHKFEVVQHCCAFQKLVETMFDRKIKIFQSDGGKEFDNAMMLSKLTI